MIHIAKGSPAELSNRVFLIGKASGKKTNELPLSKFEYFKAPEGYTFLVKANQEAEELRVLGSKIADLVQTEITEIGLIGDEKHTLVLAEGLALSTYQFNRFFKHPKNHSLTSIIVADKTDDKLIAELNNIVKAVFWTRDAVNLPVSHLNATQLADKIVELGNEASFTVQVL